jgi:Histidine kinase-, DNA gyrase B-, and HSP90-like ATPase
LKRKVNITPDVSLMRKSGEVNYKLPLAVAELVDNSVDERLPGRKLTVEVTVGQKRGEKRITVADTGGGMTREDAEKAMVMAYSKKSGDRIGEFGLGMKTACSFLGSKFEVVTATARAKKAIRIYYDEEAFLKAGAWEIELEEVAKPFDHGTIITITDLKVNLYAGAKNTLMDRFSKIFKHFIAAGEAEILVNGDPVEPHIPETIKEYDTNIEFEVNGKLVKGWASLSPKGSPKGGYGFDLIRHNRQMIEHEKLGFQPQAALTRLIGELYLDDFPVVNNKTDFRRDTAEWNEMVRILNEEWIADLKRESRKRANPGKFAPKDQAEVEEYVDQVKEALKSDELQQDLDRRALEADLADEFTDGPIPFEVPVRDADGPDPSEADEDSDDVRADDPHRGTYEPSSVDRHRMKRIKTQLRNITIEHQIARLGKDSGYKIWDVEGVANRKKLVVTTNRDHPMYTAMADGFMLWVKHNIVEAVAELFTDATGKTEAMLLIKSDILKHVGKMRLEMLDEPDYETDDVSLSELA